jgi:gliding motility-associated-like protein
VVSDIQGCTDTAERTVRVLGYAGLLSYSPLTGCSPLTVSFIANIQNVPSIIWDFSDGVTQPATGQTTTHTYQTPGAYVPKLVLSDGTLCQASSLGLDTIKVDGVLPGFTHGTACIGSPVVFTDTSRSFFSAISQAQWYFPSGPGATGPVTTRNFPTAGTYPVTLVSTNAAGCKDTVVRSVTVNSLPTVNAGPDTSICIGSTATLGATGAVSYVWSPAATLSNPAIANPAASPTVPTTYTVVGTDANGCKGKDSIRILLQTKTTATVAPGDSTCFGTPLQLLASGAETYQWVPATGLDNPAIANPLATPAQTTTYLVISRESTCIPDSDRVTVVIWPKPEVNAGTDVQIYSGKSTQLVAYGPSINTFLWSPAEGLSCTDCADPEAAPKRTTEYIIYASNNFGCSDTDAVVVTVLCDQSQLFIPNSFSPNSDGQNDRFFPHGTGLDRVISFRVYNRWGQAVYERAGFAPNSDADGWDGTHLGSALPPDTFVYIVEAECTNGERIQVKGDVTLVR